MTTAKLSSLLGWVGNQLLGPNVRRAKSTRQQHRSRTRLLSVEPLEQRALLSVSTLSQTWKELDFVGMGNLTGSFKGIYGTTPYTGKIAGPVNVQGAIKYDSNMHGTGEGTVAGTVQATITGYGPVASIDVTTPEGQSGLIVDDNGNLSIAVPEQVNASGDPLVLTGKFDTKRFTVTATTSLSVMGNQGTGTWKGTITPTSIEPFTVQVAPHWDLDNFGTVDLNVLVGGPVQKASSRTTAVATVSLGWGNVSGKQLKKLPDSIPILWNQAGGKYEISNLPTPPVTATHLLLVTKIGRVSQTTFLSLADLPTTAELKIDSIAIAEPVRGTVNAVFTVSLQGTSLAPVTVQYQTVGDTATSGTDFTATSGMLVFTPGKTTTQTITVKIKADKLLEDDERFFLQLSQPKYATLADPGQGIGTIKNT